MAKLVGVVLKVNVRLHNALYKLCSVCERGKRADKCIFMKTLYGKVVWYGKKGNLRPLSASYMAYSVCEYGKRTDKRIFMQTLHRKVI